MLYQNSHRVKLRTHHSPWFELTTTATLAVVALMISLLPFRILWRSQARKLARGAQSHHQFFLQGHVTTSHSDGMDVEYLGSSVTAQLQIAVAWIEKVGGQLRRCRQFLRWCVISSIIILITPALFHKVLSWQTYLGRSLFYSLSTIHRDQSPAITVIFVNSYKLLIAYK